ncbi:DNA polymerase III subunit delta' [Paenibacillus physcomitrellae]|uniref:DNA polymerase III subunit delta n=1 Tax=Paenibacillus physcomitrellae TaxID=1619311 RepID=A0ABQ1GVQ6_9BACL|nr:DNA polymerase III subunit delta' [Paenibacillus physcomitrellae]GGA51241.1 DNA polymerase III subunit delta' [Paenibacillus physcomitrellae]
MLFKEIVGQEGPKKLLQNGLRHNRISHAYIFNGPPGSGQMEMALAFVQALFCTNGTEEACGTCLECRKLLHGNHPDLQIVSPDGANIKIDQIRELQRIFSYRSENGNPKAYIIDQADKMNVQAANSLLKFLEEPPSPAVAILLSSNGKALLPTIQSRAQWVAFSALDPMLMLQKLSDEGIPDAIARTAVHLAAGLSACRELAGQNWFAEIRNVVLQLGKESAGRGGSPLITAQQSVFKAGLGDHLEMIFDLFHLWFKDMLQAQANRHDRIVFIDEWEFISKTAGTRSAGAWVSCMAFAAESKKKLRYNMNGQLCLEQFLLNVGHAVPAWN